LAGLHQLYVLLQSEQPVVLQGAAFAISVLAHQGMRSQSAFECPLF
jgi:hypothetical protein